MEGKDRFLGFIILDKAILVSKLREASVIPTSHDIPNDDVQEDHGCYDTTFDVIIDSKGQSHGDQKNLEGNLINC